MAREIEACGAVEPPQFFVFNFGKRHWMPKSSILLIFSGGCVGWWRFAPVEAASYVL
jgi:hypothetical protein